MVLVPNSLKLILSLSPRSRLTPLKDAVVGDLVELVAQVVVLPDQVAAHGVAADGPGPGVAVDRAAGDARQGEIGGRQVGDAQQAAVVGGRHLVGEVDVGIDRGDQLVDRPCGDVGVGGGAGKGAEAGRQNRRGAGRDAGDHDIAAGATERRYRP